MEIQWELMEVVRLVRLRRVFACENAADVHLSWNGFHGEMKTLDGRTDIDEMRNGQTDRSECNARIFRIY